MDREVRVGEKDYKIRIGYGVYQRIDALSVFLRVATPDTKVDIGPDGAPLSAKEKVEVKKEGIEASKAALVSEEVMTPAEASDALPSTLTDGMKLIDLMDIEMKLGEKVNDAKLRIIEMAVREKNGGSLSRDYIESGLSPLEGEQLFTLVMETYETYRQQIEAEGRKKKY